MTRRIVILCDIDDTFINFNASTHSIIWNGGFDIWQASMLALKATAAQAGIEVHFGIATFKPRCGDVISRHVLERLGNLIDPELVFFTNGACKVTNALTLVKNKYQAGINSKDIFIIDDVNDVITKARNDAFSAIHADKLTQASPAIQRQRVINLFGRLFAHLNLAAPKELSHLDIDEEKADAEEAKLQHDRDEEAAARAAFAARQSLQVARSPSTAMNLTDIMRSLSINGINISDIKGLDDEPVSASADAATNTNVPSTAVVTNVIPTAASVNAAANTNVPSTAVVTNVIPTAASVNAAASVDSPNASPRTLTA